MDSVVPTFEIEDQGDEEFFDKLVDDTHGLLENNNGFNEAKSLTNLGDNAMVPDEIVDSMGNDDFRDNAEKGTLGEIMDDGEKNSLTSGNVVEGEKEVKSEVDCEKNDRNVRQGTSVKEVDWSAFNCTSHLTGGTGKDSCSDFFNELGESSDNLCREVADFSGVSSDNVGCASEGITSYPSSNDNWQQQGQNCWSGKEQRGSEQDQSIQYWENLYPGWKYDANTGQWYQEDGYNETCSTLQSYDNSVGLVDNNVVTAEQSGLSSSHQTTQSAEETVTKGTAGIISNYNQGQQGNVGYPSHILFDPQYPGWYYDSIAQEWRSLESYTAATMPAQVVDTNQHNQNTNVSTVESAHGRNHSIFGNLSETTNYNSQAQMGNGQLMGWSGSTRDYNHQNLDMLQPEPGEKSEAANFTKIQPLQNPYGTNYNVHSSADQQNQQMWALSSVTSSISEQSRVSFGNSNMLGEVQNFCCNENLTKHVNQQRSDSSQYMQLSSAYIDNQKTLVLHQQSSQTGMQLFSAANTGRSSAEHPPHALVSFGFGGKLIVMRDSCSFPLNSPYGSQDSGGGVISIINLIELVPDNVDPDNVDASRIGLGARDYFYALCKQSFPGPLVGVSVANKELSKWIDDKIANCGSRDVNYRKGELLRLLFSLLKIACQYKGKLRSPFSTDHTKEDDYPETAVADLFASAKRNMSEYGALSHCVQNFPSEGQIQDTALKVQKLLVSGRIKEALYIAQEGQLWGPALVLATQLGDQFYGDTVKQMALRQLLAGSPLRTLCLLISGQPADVFCSFTNDASSIYTETISQQPAVTGALAMLHNWEENLAIITANRTKDDELVIIHLGDCLLKDKGEVIGAHICYLVSEANFESYSDSARMCLIGADHWRSPRTYASPEAIQRTELYEYSKTLGNPQFLLLPFQPYKLIYAFMLAEVGKLSESLKYCQAILKCLKIGRASEVETWKYLVTSLEERIRIHQQGGYTASLVPANLVGKFLNLFDSTAHRVVGGLPPPVPSASHGNAHKHERQKAGPKLSNSQSFIERLSLAPSASMEPINDWPDSRTPRHHRSISEPDIGKTPRKSDASKEANSSDMHEKALGLGGYYRFGRFGSQLFQKTVGRVLRSCPDRQAKLGEKNKFYYDENLKRWVEEGAELPSEEAALPPPPTTSALQNKTPNENMKDGIQTESSSSASSDSSSGLPPIPSSSNHFTASGRMGARARYVDTFNRGAGITTNKFQSSVISPKPGSGPKAKFFVPTPMSQANETARTFGQHMQDARYSNGSPTSSTEDISPSSKSTSAVTLQRIPSMDIITTGMSTTNNNIPPAPHSRRTVSWSGSFGEVSNPSNPVGFKTLGEAFSTPPSTCLPSPHDQFSPSGSSIISGDDLHDVELK